MFRSLAIGLLMLLVGGCATRYVVLSDVPDNPKFTAIPGSVSRANMEFSNLITTALVSCGVYVIERPALLTGYAESQAPYLESVLAARPHLAAAVWG